MKKIFLILSVVALIFISCNSKKKTVPTDGEITDNDSVSADDDDSGTLPDSVENDETGEIDDQTVEPDSEVDQDIVDEDPYP
ncbi:MAG TPA: hypothetical protein PLX56_10590 [bacterium]|nr:hypothetical protein [bacterium]